MNRRGEKIGAIWQAYFLRRAFSVCSERRCVLSVCPRGWDGEAVAAAAEAGIAVAVAAAVATMALAAAEAEVEVAVAGAVLAVLAFLEGG